MTEIAFSVVTRSSSDSNIFFILNTVRNPKGINLLLKPLLRSLENIKLFKHSYNLFMEAQYIYGCSVSIFFYLADKNDYEIDTDSDKKSTVVQK